MTNTKPTCSKCKAYLILTSSEDSTKRTWWEECLECGYKGWIYEKVITKLTKM